MPTRQVNYIRQHTESQYFPEEFFSGADVVIYFGDVWVADLTGFNFSLTETIKPVFGYASHTWDAVKRGIRIINGQFRIAFKDSGYLFTILDKIAEAKERAVPDLAHMFSGMQLAGWQANALRTIEADISAASQYETTVWTEPFQPELKEKRKRRPFFDKNLKLNKYGFDIYISYGPLPYDVAEQGNIPAFTGYNNTVSAIRNVQITGCSQILDASGKPVEEMYIFIAQDKD